LEGKRVVDSPVLDRTVLRIIEFAGTHLLPGFQQFGWAQHRPHYVGTSN
jgi:hypothetical protein